MANRFVVLTLLATLALPGAGARAFDALSTDGLRRAGDEAHAGLRHAIAGKNSIVKQCERNADQQHLTGLQRQAHIESCLKTLAPLNEKKNS